MPTFKTSRKHWLGRPPREATEVLRLTLDGKWVEDDGKPGIAFSGLKKGYPYAWGVDNCCPAWQIHCPHRFAMSKTCDRFSAANGGLMRKPVVSKAIHK